MFGYASTDFTGPESPVRLALTSSAREESGEKDISLLDLVKSSVVPCRLNPFLFNGHAHTVWVASGPHADIPIHYKRRIFESDNVTYPGQFTVDFAFSPTAGEAKERNKDLPPRTHNFEEEEWSTFGEEEHEKPLLVVMHGLSGGSQEHYLRHTIQEMTTEERGFDACVINGRGCAWSTITTPYLFNARATWDMRQFVKWLKQTWPNRKIYAIGYSMGANILCNYLGEEGAGCQVDGAVLVGNPWNLDVANSALESTWIGMNVYLTALSVGLKKLFERFVIY
jgi:predicted alpha/beta-fold hydrolase